MSEITQIEIMEHGFTELEAREVAAFWGLFGGWPAEYQAWLKRIAPEVKKYGWQHVKYMQLIEYLKSQAIRGKLGMYF